MIVEEVRRASFREEKFERSKVIVGGTKSSKVKKRIGKKVARTGGSKDRNLQRKNESSKG